MDTIDQNLMQDPDQGFISLESASYLRETRKWAKFLAILGFISMGLLVIFGIIGLVSMMNMGISAYITLLYIVIGILFIFPYYYLFKFSSHMKTALMVSNPGELNEAFRNLKSFFKYLGIFAIVTIVLYILAIIGAMIFGLSMFGGGNLTNF